MLGSPQVFREREFSFQMYFNEGCEPPHVHVVRGDGVAKFWLSPVSLAWNKGFHRGELRWIEQQLTSRCIFFLEQWHAIQAKTR